MKNKISISIITITLAAVFVTGCGTTFQNIQEILGSPQQVQAEITILGGIAKPKISADAQVKIHNFAIQLQNAASLDLTPLFALIPPTGSQNADALIAAAKAYLTSVVQKYGENNQTALSYAKAVAAGLLANFTETRITLKNIRTDRAIQFESSKLLAYPTRFVERVPSGTQQSKMFTEHLKLVAAQF